MNRRTRAIAAVLIVGLAALTVYNWMSLLADAPPPVPVSAMGASPGLPEARAVAAAPARGAAPADAASATPSSLTHVRGKRGESARDVAQRVFGDKERWRDLALRNGLLETERLREDTALLVDLDAVVASGLRIVRDPFRLHDSEGPVAQRAAAAPRRARKLLPISDTVSVSVPEDPGMTAVAFIRGKAYGVGDVSPSGRIIDITQEGVTVEVVAQAEPGAAGAAGQRKAPSTNEPANKMVIEVEK